LTAQAEAIFAEAAKEDGAHYQGHRDCAQACHQRRQSHRQQGTAQPPDLAKKSRVIERHHAGTN